MKVTRSHYYTSVSYESNSQWYTNPAANKSLNTYTIYLYNIQRFIDNYLLWLALHLFNKKRQATRTSKCMVSCQMGLIPSNFNEFSRFHRFNSYLYDPSTIINKIHGINVGLHWGGHLLVTHTNYMIYIYIRNKITCSSTFMNLTTQCVIYIHHISALNI